MFDCHIHSNFSSDSKLNISRACDIAIKRNLFGVIFTDHYEFNFPNSKYKFNFDFNERFKVLSELKNNLNNNLKILQGLEIGFQQKFLTQLIKISESFYFDFIILSVHQLGENDIADTQYYLGKNKKEIFEKYLKEVYSSVTDFFNYDVIGHIGYIRRYCNFQDNSMNYKDYRDLIDMILGKVIDQGKGIEVNASGYRYNLDGPTPDYEILKRYKELGGQILTIGSDSHIEDNVGLHFEIVKDNLKNIGYKYLTYFENRKPIFYKI